ncbi:VacJ family lipoprotein [Defluviimonas aestuarii]|uniref:MlaA family lipoprotein n=1 Tax=Albidovulum aestuarii TaxID=1130726 RepID=UPI00249A9EEC|nr:VacJ family lipoprotein [Defluviimonas aestuarii]MDI3338347.1 VacJ family lipoprotein [Defluviimonas aestuarii]
MSFFDRRGVAGVSAAILLLAGACSAPEPGSEFNDPHEAHNRAVHEENLAMDRALFGGGKPDKKPLLPQPVANTLGNVADNLGTPSDVVNNVLQVRPKPALTNTVRFVVNSTVGILGLFDPATAMGIYADETDFGETLHVWGVREGAYLVVPVAGPTTERDLAGKVVDAIIDPVGALTGPPESYYIGAAKLGGKVADRQRYGDTIDSILYESADSYAQMRLLYLQNRHFELGIEDEADVFDPYEDPYAQ